MTWLIHSNELTVEQSRAVELNPNEHRLILGSPGSGKTIVLLHRANYLATAYQVSPERYRIFVFTRALKSYIRAALQDLDLPDDSVTTFDAWCLDFYRHHIDNRAPWNTQTKQHDYALIRQSVWEKTQTYSASERPYDFILVDEGQDLDLRAFEILKSVAQHVTVFMDHKQQLYETGADEQGILKALGLKRRNLTLLQAYRCSPYIVQVAASFVRDPTEREAFVHQHPPIKTARQTPLLYLAHSPAEEKAHLIEMIRNRVNKNERIAVLFPNRRKVYGYALALHDAGLEVEVPPQPGRGGKRKTTGKNKPQKAPLPTHDFSTSLPKLMPYPSAKGLTFDTVLMPCIMMKEFPRQLSSDTLERWLFVGITRATEWVYFSTLNDQRFLFLDRFKALEQRQQLTIKLTDDMFTGAKPTITDSVVTDTIPTDAEEEDWSDQF